MNDKIKDGFAPGLDQTSEDNTIEWRYTSAMRRHDYWDQRLALK